jgi:hypothetical protein
MSRYDYEYQQREPELSWGPFLILMTLTSYFAFVLGAMSVATGLFYLAELAEEFPTMTRRLLKALIVAVCCMMGLFAALDGMPLWRCCLTVAAHVLYGQLLPSFPWIKLTSPVCIASISAFILDNVSWYIFFISNGGQYPFWSVISFFLLCVWATPMGFFISLAATEDQLPHGGFADSRAGGGGGKRRTVSALLSSIANGSFWIEKQ